MIRPTVNNQLQYEISQLTEIYSKIKPAYTKNVKF